MYIDLVDLIPTRYTPKRVRTSLDQIIAQCVTTSKSLLGSKSAIINLTYKNEDPSGNKWNSNNQFESILKSQKILR